MPALIARIMLKDQIEFFQWKIQSVDITPESPDILLQSFQAHQQIFSYILKALLKCVLACERLAVIR
mgnify:CR=1 FL=1